jgi:hypothetical protein
MDEILFDYPSDLLDAYCYDQFGHTNWEQISDPNGNIVIKFKPKEREYKVSKPLHEMNQAELREYWGNKSSNFLVGKTVRRVRYLTESEREDLGWFRSLL